MVACRFRFQWISWKGSQTSRQGIWPPTWSSKVKHWTWRPIRSRACTRCSPRWMPHRWRSTPLGKPLMGEVCHFLVETTPLFTSFPIPPSPQLCVLMLRSTLTTTLGIARRPSLTKKTRVRATLGKWRPLSPTSTTLE